MYDTCIPISFCFPQCSARFKLPLTSAPSCTQLRIVHVQVPEMGTNCPTAPLKENEHNIQNGIASIRENILSLGTSIIEHLGHRQIAKLDLVIQVVVPQLQRTG